MQRVKDTGAAELIAADDTINSAPRCLDASGIRSAVEKAGFSMVACGSGDFVERTFKCSDLAGVRVMKRLYDADVLIDVPVIKSHGTTKMTGGLKNLVGMVSDRQAMHASASLDVAIADLGKALQPDLVIADAYRVMVTGGPGGGREQRRPQAPRGHRATTRSPWTPTPPRCWWLSPQDVDHLKAAYDEGIGEIDTGKLNFLRVSS
jgi:uncharacterized protein (DUF362 family)